MVLNYQNLFSEGPEQPNYPELQNPETNEGGGGSGESPKNGQTPCAPGYKKKFNEDGSFECVPVDDGLMNCGYSANGEVLFGRTDRVSPSECDRRFAIRQANLPPITPTNTTANTPGGSTPTNAGGNVPLPNIENPYTDYEKQLWESYNKLFNGAKVEAPYTPEVIARLEGKLKSAAEINKATNKQNYLAGRSAMGLGNTGRTSQGLRNINNAADQKTAEGAIDINHTAIRANYDAEVANIQRKVQILDSQTQFALALAGNAIERTKIQYNYQLQRMQINNQLEMLKLQLLAQLGAK